MKTSHATDKDLVIDVDRKEMNTILEKLLDDGIKQNIQADKIECLAIKIPNSCEEKMTPRNYLEVFYQIACMFSFWLIVAYVVYRIFRHMF